MISGPCTAPANSSVFVSVSRSPARRAEMCLFSEERRGLWREPERFRRVFRCLSHHHTQHNPRSCVFAPVVPTMSSLRNAVKRVEHKERAQPASRRKLGLLEKHKDYGETGDSGEGKFQPASTG